MLWLQIQMIDRLCFVVHILDKINGHDDLINLTDKEKLRLCDEIRQFLVSNVSRTGGHLASNLGVVELTVAVETVFDSRIDRVVFDVGHQSYVHKLLTGRKDEFRNLRQFGGIAGFPKPCESNTDSFVAGHASSSVSIALGMARARSMLNENYQVVSIIGDGAATGGMAYEGLNDASVSHEPMVIILNDNEMSIDKNVGGLSKHLSKLRTKEKYLGMKAWYRSSLQKIPGGGMIYRVTSRIKGWLKRVLLPATIFENMGLMYLGPVDGHDLLRLIPLLRSARDLKRPVLVHVLTQKGHGYTPAELHPSKFHGVGKFDPETGELIGKKGPVFSDVFGETMCELAKQNPKVCAITAAMPGGTGLLNFKKTFPDRLFDVGIAEEHAVSMAGGLAKQGAIPVVALYSTFLQRAYDQIMQDIALLHLHVVIAVDRAGLVGEDGETHHGVFDVGFLRQVPGMMVLCPGSCRELKEMLSWSVNEYSGPVAIRYPRGGDRIYMESHWSISNECLQDGVLHCHRCGKDVTLITYGVMIDTAIRAANKLSAIGIEATVLRILTAAPLPVSEIVRNLSTAPRVIVIEETAEGTGIFEPLASQIHNQVPNCTLIGMNLGDHFVTHGSLDALYRSTKLDVDSVVARVQEVCRCEE